MLQIDNSTKGDIDFSWIETYTFYYEEYRNRAASESSFITLEKYLRLIKKLIKDGCMGKFRIGTSMYRLILSRSIKHHLRSGQRMIMLDISKGMIRLTHNLGDAQVKESIDLRDLEDLNVYVDQLSEFPFD